MTKRNRASECFRFVALIVTAAVAFPQTGCSFTISRPPPQRTFTIDEPPRCSSNLFPPIFDTIGGATAAGMGGLFLLGGMLAYQGEKNGTSWDPRVDHSGSGTALTLGVGSLILAGVFAWSAKTGFENARDCRRLRRDYRNALENVW